MLTLIAFSIQAAYAAALGPTDLKDSHYYFPDSSIPKWFDAGKGVHSHVEMWNGGLLKQDIGRYAMAAPEEVGFGPRPGNSTPAGYGPNDIKTAYGLPALGGNKAIAIVDAYHYANALNDFNYFSRQYGLPTEASTNATLATNQSFQLVYQGSSAPSVNASWNMEAALDIEWAHAIAPDAKIYLVEANSSSLSDMFAAVKKAAALPNVKEVSMSWGSTEYSSETSADSSFTQAGVVYFSSSGDTTAVPEYPSESPNVVAVGGTSLSTAHGTVTETPWMGSGGGISRYEPIPSYQKVISAYVGNKRGAADISAVADPSTGVAIYDSTPVNGHSGWLVVGGTSLSCPVAAAIANVTGVFSSSSAAELTKIYAAIGTGGFRKITNPANPKATWYYAVGVGSPIGSKAL
jgi:subtilase family serine protease